MMTRVGERIGEELDRLGKLSAEDRVKQRKDKFLNIGMRGFLIWFQLSLEAC